MKQTIRIIHVSAAASWRGGEQQLAYLLKAMKNQNVDQEVLCVKNSPLAEYCKKEKIKTTVFSKKSSVNLSASLTLARLYKSRSQNCLVHCHDSHAHNIAFLSAWLFSNPAPLIVHRRVDFPVSASFLSKAKYNHHSIKKFICVSEAIKDLLVPSLEKPDKAVVIHSGIDLSRFDKAENKNLLRAEFKLSGNHILIGNVAAIAPHKDYYTFINTAEILLKANPDFHFFIIGDGPDRAAIKAEVRSRGLEDKIHLTGFRNNIPELLKELNVLLLTSKTEGLGTSILDAFACKLPVVATKTGGIPEIVEHRHTGLLANAGDAKGLAEMVLLMLTDTGLRENITGNAIVKVVAFDYQNTASKIMNIYTEVLDSNIYE
jgi:L-malate glycosyltransferase